MTAALHARRGQPTKLERDQMTLPYWRRRRPGLRYVLRLERELMLARMTIEKLEARLAGEMK